MLFDCQCAVYVSRNSYVLCLRVKHRLFWHHDINEYYITLKSTILQQYIQYLDISLERPNQLRCSTLYIKRKNIQWAWSIQPKFQPVQPGKLVHLKRWTSFRNFSGWTEPIHWVLDRNFRKFWLNGSCPITPINWVKITDQVFVRQFIAQAWTCWP